MTKTYGYDKLDRLTSYSNETYFYDTDGNRSSHQVGATTYPYTYPTTSNRLTSFTGPAARSYTYDASGNVATISSGFAFSYDARGRMTNITTGSLTQLGINGLGERVTKAGTGYTGTIRYLCGEDGKLMGEYDNTGAATLEHVYLQDTPIAALKGTGAYLVQADHLNTPRAILGAANALVWKWDSDAFGSTAANENPSALGIFTYNLRFPGQYYDKETTLHYNYLRDIYNPKIGRYFESDPIGLKGGINTYAYVGGNPISKKDPLGLWSLTVEGYIGGIGGGIVIGRNPDGNGFVSLRAGAGFGGGVSYDKNGVSPGYTGTGVTPPGWSSSIGVFGSGGVTIGPGSLGVGAAAGLNSDSSCGRPTGYLDFPGLSLSGSPNFSRKQGLSGGAAGGVEVTFY